jgi:L-lysine 6-transaminase
MSTIPHLATRIPPQDVHAVLARHMLVDGYRLVMDLEKSHGSFLFDSRDGRDVLDFYMGFSTIPVGYNHPKLFDEAFKERLLWAAANKVANADVYTTLMAEFVEAFARTVPEAFRQRLFFIEGGALAVENALKTAFDWKVRKNLAKGKGEKGSQIIHFRQAFHGRSGYTLSLTNTTDPRKTMYFPKFPWPRVNNPKLRFPVDEQVLAEVAAAEAATIAQVEQALRDNPDDIAGLIIETIQGEGGDNHFRPEFFRALRRLADEHEFLLIFDEVQAGFGVTGTWWAFEQLGVEPDVFAFGKKTQVCGIAAGPRVDEVDSVFKVSSRINSTWGGNLVDMVRCQRIIEIIEEEDLLGNARRMGAHLLAGLERLCREQPLASNARGRGMFAAIDLPSGEQRDRAIRAMRERGVLALPSGDFAIRFRPCLNLRQEDIDEGLRRLAEALSTL